MIRLAEHVASMGEIRNAYKIFAEIPKGKPPLGKPNIKNYLEMHD
jgi:hypothetical protein